MPFFDTAQAKLKPAVLSIVLGSVAEPPRLMAVPSGLVAGAPLIDGVGATFATMRVSASLPVVSSSLTTTVTV